MPLLLLLLMLVGFDCEFPETDDEPSELEDEVDIKEEGVMAAAAAAAAARKGFVDDEDEESFTVSDFFLCGLFPPAFADPLLPLLPLARDIPGGSCCTSNRIVELKKRKRNKKKRKKKKKKKKEGKEKKRKEEKIFKSNQGTSNVVCEGGSECAQRDHADAAWAFLCFRMLERKNSPALYEDRTRGPEGEYLKPNSAAVLPQWSNFSGLTYSVTFMCFLVGLIYCPKVTQSTSIALKSSKENHKGKSWG